MIQKVSFSPKIYAINDPQKCQMLHFFKNFGQKLLGASHTIHSHLSAFLKRITSELPQSSPQKRTDGSVKVPQSTPCPFVNLFRPPTCLPIYLPNSPSFTSQLDSYPYLCPLLYFLMIFTHFCEIFTYANKKLIMDPSCPFVHSTASSALSIDFHIGDNVVSCFRICR